MQLYKGNEENGKINWQPPTIEKSTTEFTDFGKFLFTQNCTSCHVIDKKLTGPSLAWMDKGRLDKKHCMLYKK